MKSFNDLLNFFIKLNADPNFALEIDNMLLYLRCSDLRDQSRIDRIKSILIGVPTHWMHQILFIPLLPFFYPRTLIMSIIVSAIFMQVFDVIDAEKFIYLAGLLWAMLNLNKVTKYALNFVFDLIDFILLGALSRLVSSMYLSLNVDKKRNFLTFKNYFFFTHLYISRHAFQSTKNQRWENHYIYIFDTFSDDQDVLTLECDLFWAATEQSEGFIKHFDPISITDNLDWLTFNDWTRVTPGIIKIILSRLDNINSTKTGWSQGGIHGPRTLLGCASAEGAQLAIIKMIVDNGADVNFPQGTFFGKSEFSILHCAVVGNSSEVVKYLIDSGADLSASSKNHELDVFQTAVLGGKDPQSLYELINASDSEYIGDERGNSLLHIAACSLDDRVAFMRVLVDLGYDAESINSYGRTPLMSAATLSDYHHFAETGRNVNNIRFLFEKSKSILNLDGQGNNFLHLYLLSEISENPKTEEELIKLCYEYNVNFKNCNSDGNTPLHLAAQYGSVHAVAQIINLGGLNESINKLGETPRDKAIKREVIDDALIFSSEVKEEILFLLN